MENTGPLIYQPSTSTSRPWITWLGRMIFLALISAIVFQLVRGARVLTLPTTNRPAVLPVSGGVITLVNPSQSTKVGQNIGIPVKILTSGHTIQGIDLVIKYDPKLIEPAQTNAFTPGNIMSEYPTVNPSPGLIRVSGIASTQQIGFNGVGLFGTVNFKTLAKGKTTISIDYKLNSTTDSNMIEVGTGQDILTNVNNLDITIN